MKRFLRTPAKLAISVVALFKIVAHPLAQEMVSDELLGLIDVTPPSVRTEGRIAAPFEKGPPGLVLHIRHVRNDKGAVNIFIYDDANAFAQGDYTRAVGYAEVKATTGTVRADFPDLIAGPYAVFVFHDENSDSAFAREGRSPEEGYGHSNSRGAFEAPPFDIAAVQPGAVEIRMHYIPPRSGWERLQEEMRR